jgi:phage gp45-like
MHRITPVDSALRAYTAGGARSVVDKADDKKLMQEMSGNFMKNESRSGVESPQNYGFTSVVAAAEKDKGGNITGSAETFISFMGGNRSFPVAGNMDDRRHRLKGLLEGASAMFGLKEWGLQYLIHDSGFITSIAKKAQQAAGGGGGGGVSALAAGSGGGSSGSSGSQQGEDKQKKWRVQFVDNKNTQQQQGTGGQQAGGGSGGGGAGGQDGQQDGQQKATGQESLHEQEAKEYVEITDELHEHKNKHHKLLLSDDDSVGVEINKSKKVYVGGPADKGSYAKIITESGPSDNSYARIGGGGGGAMLLAAEPALTYSQLIALAIDLRQRVEALESKLTP